MANLSIGSDLVDIRRFSYILGLYGKHFLSTIYTEYEKDRYKNKIDELAQVFAAKEAISKTLNVGLVYLSPDGIMPHDAEIRIHRNKPDIHLHGRAAELAQSMCLKQWAISLSCANNYAVAFVIATSG